MNEELLHLFPRLKHRVVGYIYRGWNSKEQGPDELMEIGFCPDCEAASRTKQIFFKRALYQTFLQSDFASLHPLGLIVTFDTGHAEAEVES